LLSFDESQAVVARGKLLVADMAWTSKRGKISFGWIEGRIPVQYADDPEVSSELYVVCQWKKRGTFAAEQWKFALFRGTDRIYAIDVQPDGGHTNDKAGRGRPLHMERIGGVHEHTWSKEGYGYAEPIDLPLDQPEVIWKKFLKRAGIAPGDFFHPDNNEPELIL
jgi:hypothetical protein